MRRAHHKTTASSALLQYIDVLYCHFSCAVRRLCKIFLVILLVKADTHRAEHIVVWLTTPCDARESTESDREQRERTVCVPEREPTTESTGIHRTASLSGLALCRSPVPALNPSEMKGVPQIP